MNVESLVFFRIFFDFLLLSPFFFRYRSQIKKEKISLHFWRAVFAIFAMALSIYGVKTLYLADAILFESTLPLFIPLLSWVMYRRRVNWRTSLVLWMGFLGVILLLNPSGNLFYLGAFASLGTALLSAITSILIAPLSKTEHPLAILFYYYLFCAIFSAVPFFLSWEGGFSVSLWLYLMGISLFGVLFQFANTRAFSLLPPHMAGGFAYFSILFAAVFGYLFWDEVFTLSKILGGAVLVLSGIFILKEREEESVSV